MAKVSYNGPLGKFDYDDTQFSVIDYYDEDRLRYIGSEVDGSKITIPDGIVNCANMFENNSTLQVAPAIPESAECCQAMFSNCGALTTPPVIPDDVRDCEAMFLDCRSLKAAPEIPEGVVRIKTMFKGCTSLKEAPVLPSKARDCSDMFHGCTSLEEPPVLPNTVKYCNYMFCGCKSLKYVPAVPVGARNSLSMTYGCTDDIKAQGAWNDAHRGFFYDAVNQVDLDSKCPGYADFNLDDDWKVVLANVAYRDKSPMHKMIYRGLIRGVMEGVYSDFDEVRKEMFIADKAMSRRMPKSDVRANTVNSALSVQPTANSGHGGLGS